jgi:hypothetical protein
MITELADAMREIQRAIDNDVNDRVSLNLSEEIADRGTPVPLDAAIAIITDALLGEGYVPRGSERIPGGRRITYVKGDL